MTSPNGTAVMVPGAWLGGWSWMPVARRLAESGVRTFTPTLPGLADGDETDGLRLDDAVDALVGLMERRDLTDVVLVCHSWGGYPATGAAHRSGGRVRKVVYYSAVVPAAGKAMSDENEEYGAVIRQALAARPDATIGLGLEAVRAVMMQDEPEPLQRAVSEMTRPQPGRYMTEALAEGAVTEAGVEAAYVLGRHDIALGRPGEEFAARLGLTPVVVPGSHLAMWTRADDVAPAIIDACR